MTSSPPYLTWNTNFLYRGTLNESDDCPLTSAHALAANHLGRHQGIRMYSSSANSCPKILPTTSLAAPAASSLMVNLRHCVGFASTLTSWFAMPTKNWAPSSHTVNQLAFGEFRKACVQTITPICLADIWNSQCMVSDIVQAHFHSKDITQKKKSSCCHALGSLVLVALESGQRSTSLHWKRDQFSISTLAGSSPLGFS